MELIVKNKNLILLLFVLVFTSCKSQEKGNDIKVLAKEEFKASMNSQEGDFYLIDVRTSSEYNQGNIEGSKNYDFLNGDFQNQIKTMDKNTPIYVYCAVGGRSGKAAQLLKNEGFTKIIDLKGGYNSWK
jgi:rhodanese-related sulfurtransferase